MIEEQMIKKIKKMWQKEKKRDPEGGISGSIKDDDTGKERYYYYSCLKDKVTFCNSFDETFDVMINDFGWFYNYIGCHFSWLKYKIDDIVCKIREAFQRMTKGYDDYAIFEMDSWFIRIIPKMLRELRDKPSAPIIKDLIPGYDPTKKENITKTPPEKYFKAWEKVLTRMIDCFEGYKDTRDFSINPYDYTTQKEKHKMWCDKQTKKNEEYLKEGLKLFVKYFRYLNW